MLTAVCLAGIISSTFAAADVRKNKPSRRDVEKILEEIGGDHYPEHMQVSSIGSVKTDSTYYHVFCGTLRQGGYHLIFFDNTPKYLGYYLISLEPTGYGEGEIYLYLTSSSTVTIPIGDDGPPEKLRIGDTGMQPAIFVPAPVKKEPEADQTAGKGTGSIKTKKKVEYRAWTITKNGQQLHIESAVFVEIKNGDVIIKSGKNDMVATVPMNSLSDKDKAYVKDLFQ